MKLCERLIALLGRRLCLLPVLFSIEVVTGAEGQTLVSTAPNFTASSSAAIGSGSPIMTRDGRFVLFASCADNLVVSGTNKLAWPYANKPANVYLRDRLDRKTTLVSVDTGAIRGGEGSSIPVAISEDGRYALFESQANNLVAGDTNGGNDVFIRDLKTATTIVVSANTNGLPGNAAAGESAMTADGRYVVFTSYATDLVENDTNRVQKLFLRDVLNGVTKRLGLGAVLPEGEAPSSYEVPNITPDGRYVVFSSVGSNLRGEIFLEESLTGKTTWISAGAKPVLTSLGVTNFTCHSALISEDARAIIYEAGPNARSGTALLSYEIATETTTLIHSNVLSGAMSEGALDMTPDGSAAAFVAYTDAACTNTCILVWHSDTGRVELVSGNLANQVQTGVVTSSPVVDATGQFVAFLCNGDALVTNNLAEGFHLYVRDLSKGNTLLVDTNVMEPVLRGGIAGMPSLSSGGRYVAYTSEASLVADDYNAGYDVFVVDLWYGTNELVSAADPSLACRTPNGPSFFSSGSIRTSASRVGFATWATDLAPSSTNGAVNLFVSDLTSGSNILVSANTNGGPANGNSTELSLSGDGNWAAFASDSTDLIPGIVDRAMRIYVRDLQHGTLELGTWNNAGTTPSTGSNPMLSGDGRFLLFESKARDLSDPAPPYSSYARLYLRDLVAGGTKRLSDFRVVSRDMSLDGRFVAYTCSTTEYSGGIDRLYVWDSLAGALVFTNVALSGPGVSGFGRVGISPDGARVVYEFNTNNLPSLTSIDRSTGIPQLISTNALFWAPGLRFSGDGRFLVYSAYNRLPLAPQTNQVYLYDFDTHENLLISRSAGRDVPANDSSDAPDISADGRFIAFRSTATDLVPSATSGLAQVYVYDRLTGSTTLLSVSRFGGSANGRSGKPAFLANGRTLVFESWASDLTEADYNAASEIFACTLLESPVPVFKLSMVRGTQGVWLTWPVLPAQTYRVQFKTSLEDAEWQDFSGAFSADQNQAYLFDPAGGPQKFYRVLAQ